MKRKNFVLATLSVLGILCLTACNSGNDNGTTAAGGGRGGTEFGFLTLSLADAPIDNATEVQIQLEGVELMHGSDSPDHEAISITFEEPVKINLLDLHGSKGRILFSNEILPTGRYNWLRLKVTAAIDGVLDTYIRLDDGTVHELEIPSDAEIGLQITDGVEIIANTPSAKTIILDLRRSVDMSVPGDFKLKPVITLVNDNETGSIRGAVRLSVLTSANCSDADPATGNEVHLYEGFNVIPDDIDGIPVEPVMSTVISLNTATGEFEYSIDYVPYGQYTLAFSCQADLDDPVTDDTIIYTRTRNISIDDNTPRIMPPDTIRFSHTGPPPGNVNFE